MNSVPGARRVSIVVRTRNRVSKLARCLEHIGNIRSGKDWELIVVDNGSTDQTPRFTCTRLSGVFPRPARVVLEPAPGGTRSRNAGSAAARGEDPDLPRQRLLSGAGHRRSIRWDIRGSHARSRGRPDPALSERRGRRERRKRQDARGDGVHRSRSAIRRDGRSPAASSKGGNMALRRLKRSPRRRRISICGWGRAPASRPKTGRS